MIKKKIGLVYFLLSYFFLNISHAIIENSIVVKIDSQIITNFEIKNKILGSLILSGKEINQKNINSLKKQSLESLIQSKIKFLEISKHNFSISDDQINQYLNSISSNDIPNLRDKFISNNLDFNLLLEEIETEFKWQKLIYQIYSKQINIDPNLIKNELTELINKNSKIKEYELSELEIFIDENDKDGKKIKKISDQIKFEGFEKTALNFSVADSSPNKGYIGWVSSKALSKDIFNILDKMTSGEISKPIRKQNNILFLKINNIRKKNLEDIDVEDLEKKIIDNKKNELFNLFSRSHLSRIRNNSLIEYK